MVSFYYFLRIFFFCKNTESEREGKKPAEGNPWKEAKNEETFRNKYFFGNSSGLSPSLPNYYYMSQIGLAKI